MNTGRRCVITKSKDVKCLRVLNKYVRETSRHIKLCGGAEQKRNRQLGRLVISWPKINQDSHEGRIISSYPPLHEALSGDVKGYTRFSHLLRFAKHWYILRGAIRILPVCYFSPLFRFAFVFSSVGFSPSVFVCFPMRMQTPAIPQRVPYYATTISTVAVIDD